MGVNCRGGKFDREQCPPPLSPRFSVPWPGTSLPNHLACLPPCSKLWRHCLTPSPYSMVAPVRGSGVNWFDLVLCCLSPALLVVSLGTASELVWSRSSMRCASPPLTLQSLALYYGFSRSLASFPLGKHSQIAVSTLDRSFKSLLPHKDTY